MLEDDPLVSELLELVLGSLVPNARIQHCRTVTAAKSAWRSDFQLIICDRNLTDGSGLDLVKSIRTQNTTQPIVMISAHFDREAVIAAARAGVNEFIAKPLDIVVLQKRLTPLLASLIEQETHVKPKTSLNTWLTKTLTVKLKMPSELAPEAVLPLLARSSELSPIDLTRAWQHEIPLTARLLHLANGASLNRSGKPVNRIDEAISALGVDMALATAMALALDIRGSLQDPRLLELATFFQTKAEQVASIARVMAMTVNLSSATCYTAGILSRAGELALLRALQDFLNQGGELNDEEIPAIIEKWSPEYGNHLKVQWGLALPMRELIGAIHSPPTHATQRSLLIMHLAALRVASRLNTPDALRMLRRSGLEVEKWWQKKEKVEATAAPATPPLPTATRN